MRGSVLLSTRWPGQGPIDPRTSQTASRKLLSIKYPGIGPRLDVQFVSEGKYGNDLLKFDKDGYTYWGLGPDGTVNAIAFEDLDTLVERLTDDNLN